MRPLPKMRPSECPLAGLARSLSVRAGGTIPTPTTGARQARGKATPPRLHPSNVEVVSALGYAEVSVLAAERPARIALRFVPPQRQTVGVADPQPRPLLPWSESLGRTLPGLT